MSMSSTEGEEGEEEDTPVTTLGAVVVVALHAGEEVEEEVFTAASTEEGVSEIVSQVAWISTTTTTLMWTHTIIITNTAGATAGKLGVHTV